MKNIEEMTTEELQELVAKRKKDEKFKKLLEKQGLNENDLIPQLIKEALINNEKIIFNVQFSNDYFEYEEQNKLVKKILFNENSLIRDEKKYLPDNFVDDLKRMGVKEFILCGEIPVRLIKEFEDKGCKLQGLYKGSYSYIENTARSLKLVGNTISSAADFIMAAKGQRKDGCGDALGDVVKEQLEKQNLTEPGLYFTL